MDSKSDATPLNLNYEGPLSKFKADDFQGQHSQAQTFRPIHPTHLDRHKYRNNAIWPENRSVISQGSVNLYYCLRCMRAFPVASSCGAVIQLGENGYPILEIRAAETLTTSGHGPCPAPNRSFGSKGETGVIFRWKSFRTRFSSLVVTFSPLWKRATRLELCALAGQSMESKKLAN